MTDRRAAHARLKAINAMSADVETDRVLKLWFTRPVTDEDRAAVVVAINSLLPAPDVAGTEGGVSDAGKAYGLLWKSTATCPLTRFARKTLLDGLSKDEQRAAVKWVVETYGPMTTADLIAADSTGTGSDKSPSIRASG